MFLNVCKQNFHISHVRVFQRVKGVLYEILNILFPYDDFQICISAPLISKCMTSQPDITKDYAIFQEKKAIRQLNLVS